MSEWTSAWSVTTVNNSTSSVNRVSAVAISEGTYLGITQYASYAIDGDSSTSWSSQGDMPAWLIVKFDQLYEIKSVGIWWGSHQHEFSISLSTDGNNWSTVVPSRLSINSEGSAPVHEVFPIAPTSAEYIKIDITSTSAPSSHIFQATVGELEASTESNTSSQIADLSVSNFSFFPLNFNLSGNNDIQHPSSISFRIINNGPTDLNSPNTKVRVEFDLFSQNGDKLLIGEYIHNFNLQVGAYQDVNLSQSDLSNLSLTGIATGTYNAYIEIESYTPSTLIDNNPNNNSSFATTSITVPVAEDNKSIQNIFQLYQNYPNPFNPATTIIYQVPKLSFVSLKVYDILGREVANLVNKEQQPGSYEVKFDGTGLSSGVYLYRMQSGTFSQTKKFILMK